MRNNRRNTAMFSSGIRTDLTITVIGTSLQPHTTSKYQQVNVGMSQPQYVEEGQSDCGFVQQKPGAFSKSPNCPTMAQVFQLC